MKRLTSGNFLTTVPFWEIFFGSFFIVKLPTSLAAIALAAAISATTLRPVHQVQAAQQSSPNAIISPKANANPLDINTATSDQLKRLPGVGDAYARRIIAGRPYTAKNQLVTRGVLPQAAYDQLASQVIAKRPR